MMHKSFACDEVINERTKAVLLRTQHGVFDILGCVSVQIILVRIFVGWQQRNRMVIVAAC